MQAGCNATNAGQVWHLMTTPFGTSLSTSSGLVIGVGAQWFGGSRLLVLRRPAMVRYQSWRPSAG